MEIKIYNKNFDLSDSFREYLIDKFSTLDKYQEDIINFNVDLVRDQHHKKGEVYKIEVTVTLPQKKVIRVKEKHSDPRAAVDMAQEKVSRQIVKTKKKRFSKLRKQARRFKSLKFWKRGR
ncbi:ribosomal subunit interface protein [Candidatus Parcubacteria bacterium]|nr:MAG: ribosomal subunit interface protein [Candidatus Parcubacteria bacterium]